MRLVLLVAAAGFASLVSTLPGPVLWAQDAEKPAIAPAPRTINLTQEQRFIIRENVKDLKLTKAQASATETIGARVPDNIELHPMPPEIAKKVPQAKVPFVLRQGWRQCHRARQSQRSAGRRCDPLASRNAAPCPLF
jgi:hypothetical protein